MLVFRTDHLRVQTYAEQGAMLSLDVAGKSVNVLGRQVLADLDAALDRLREVSFVRVLGVRSGKSSGFAVGPDAAEVARLRTAQEAEEWSAFGQGVFEKLACVLAPTVAVIHGPCLGGGLEWAMACDYRLVVDHQRTQLGLAEAELGLVPGWGGTQRLPWLVGLERSLRMIVGRQRLDARTAVRWGLADAVAGSEAEQAVALGVLFARAIAKGKRRRRGLPLRTWRQRAIESTPLGRRLIWRRAERWLEARVPEAMPAPRQALEAVRAGLTHGEQAGLRAEREAVGRLWGTAACRNLLQLALRMGAARKDGRLMPAGDAAEHVRSRFVGRDPAREAGLRVLVPYLAETVELAAGGLAIERVDGVMRRFGMALGPFELIDDAGMDAVLGAVQKWAAEFGDRPDLGVAVKRLAQVLEGARARGWLGREGGAGFYRYRGARRRVHRAVEGLLAGVDRPGVGEGGLPQSLEIAVREGRERVILLTVNEAARCCGEGMGDAAAVDLAVVTGVGWAAHRGGPLRYADERGTSEVARALGVLAGRFGGRFEPCEQLKKRAATGEPFYVRGQRLGDGA